MRTSLKTGLALTVLVLLAAAAWWAFGNGAEVKPVAQQSDALPPPAKKISVQAPAGTEGLTLRGVVKDASGNPVGGARVFLASSEQGSLTTARCTCERLLLACTSLESVITVDALLEQHRGTLEAALETTAAADGTFAFSHLSGVSFTVWAHAAGFGTGVKDRAAPGETAEVIVPTARSIRGIVRSEHGVGVPARVRIISRRLAEVSEVNTDGAGKFTQTDLGEGPFYVMATAADWLPAVAREVPGDSGALELVMRKPRSLLVTLLADGQPIDGTVYVNGTHLKRSAVSSKGLATVDRLPDGTVAVSAIAGALAALPQSVQLKETTTRLTLNLSRGGTLAVTVQDDDEQPVSHAKLSVLSFSKELLLERELQPGELAVLGPYGAGEYQLIVEAQGFTATSVPVTVTPGETPVTVTLTKTTVIAGKVVDEYGRTAAGVSVQVMPLGRNVMSDADGHFVAPVPSPGQYVLNAHHSDWGGTSLKVKAPKDDVVLSLEGKATAEVVVMSGGERVEGASAHLIYGTGNFSSDRPSGADGVVMMRGIPPGAYELMAQHPAFLPSARQPVTLEEGKTLRFTVELARGLKAEGLVVDENEVPVAGVDLGVAGGLHLAKSDAEGRFVIEPVRKVNVLVFRIQSRLYRQQGKNTFGVGEPVVLHVKRLDAFRGRVLCGGVPAHAFRVEGREVTSADGTFEEPLERVNDSILIELEAPGCEPLSEMRTAVRPDLGDFDLKRLPQFSGLVRDEGGAPVADAQVSCVPCDVETRSKADGTFSLPTPSFPIQTTVIAKKGSKSASRTVMPEQFSAPVSLTLGKGTVVSGIVYSAAGAPMPGADLEIFSASDNLSKMVVTGDDGSYSVEVTPGSYQFVSQAAAETNSDDEPSVLYIEVSGTEKRINIGAAPGTSTLTAAAPGMTGGSMCWVLKGSVSATDVSQVVSAPWAKVYFKPRAGQFIADGLEPGTYSVGCANIRGRPGPMLRAQVQIPQSGEVLLRPDAP